MAVELPSKSPINTAIAREKQVSLQQENIGAALKLAFIPGGGDLPADMEALLVRLV